MTSHKWRATAASCAIIVALSWQQAGAQSPASREAGRRDAIAELVAANHVLAKLKVVDAFGHVSVRDPANPQRYLMARSMAPALVTERDILELDLDSNPIDRSVGEPSIERFIHGEIYKVRSDVNAVVHSHSPSIIPFSVSQTPLRPISHVGAFLAPAVPVYDTQTTVGPSNLLVSNQKIGRALAETLAGNVAVLIRGHGNAVVGSNVGQAVYRAYFTEVSAQLLLQARQLDGPIKFLDPDEAAKANDLRNTGYIRQWQLWKLELAGK